ncbi:MAG TPA: DUF1003 domain-containing protein [Candidatus Dormibacteraeota bacterium]|nr:DUF1003 domain-containing protein [Candidatus Dormibacteraeota bacterium]
MGLRTSDTGHVAIKEKLHRRKYAAVDHDHPVNVVHHDEATFGERIADAAASGIGSWRFLIVQTIAVLAWLIVNIYGFVNRWDPFPFILLNLLFSVQAAYTGPVLLLAGNRQAQKDRLTLEHAAHEADKADEQNVEILNAIKQISELTEKNTEVTLTILRHVESLVQQHVDDLQSGRQTEPKRT